MPAEEIAQKSSDKPPPRQSQHAGEKRSAEKISPKKYPILPETSTLAVEQISTKRPPQEIGVRLEATEKSSRKGPPYQRLKEALELREAEERLCQPTAHVFGDEPPEETGQKRSAKAPPQHEVPAEEIAQKSSDKPPPRQSQHAGEKRSTKRPPRKE